MKKLLITVIIPVYNVKEFIEECLQSVLDQSYANLEIIIVNDCSPDNSMEVAKPLIAKLISKYSVTVVEHEKNGGLSEARNSGLKEANGDYVFFLDSDDVLFKDSIEKLISKMIGNEDIIMGNFIRSNAKSASPIQEMYLDSNDSVFESFILNRWNVMACNKLIRRGLINDLKLFFRPGLLHEDELYSFNLSLVANSIQVVDETTYWYRIRDGAITSRFSEKNVNAMLEVINLEVSSYKKKRGTLEQGRCFYHFIVQKCYIALVMAYLGKTKDIETVVMDLREILTNIKTLKNNQLLLKEKLLFLPKPFIYVYMSMLKIMKSFVS